MNHIINTNKSLIYLIKNNPINIYTFKLIRCIIDTY
nr:MAG TPA: hypothetical protein [Caudoviricetes sp.]